MNPFEILLNLVGTDVVLADTTPESILAAGDLEISGHGFSVNGYAFDSAMVTLIESIDAGRSTLVVVKPVSVIL